MDDVTEKLTMDLSSPAFDSGSNTFSVDASLVNNSDTAVHGPVAARVLRLSSSMGVVRIVTPANGITGPGALWNFGDELTGGQLAPHQHSSAKRLLFWVPTMHPLSITNFYGLVKFDAELLAPHQAAGASAK
jgi:hypothetical protein